MVDWLDHHERLPVEAKITRRGQPSPLVHQAASGIRGQVPTGIFYLALRSSRRGPGKQAEL